MERDKLIAEWGRLVGKESQVAQIAPSRPQYEKRGEREAARQLGLDRDDVRRAFKVASLSSEAQQTAHDVGLADNRAALLAGLNLIAHAAHTLGDYVEQCQNELERAAQKPGKGASHE